LGGERRLSTIIGCWEGTSEGMEWERDGGFEGGMVEIGCLVERNRLVGVQAGFHGCCAVWYQAFAQNGIRHGIQVVHDYRIPKWHVHQIQI
jgi:hypothetical protein